MSIRSHIAVVRFGYGLRLGEPPPSDPVAWLEEQLVRPAAAPEGASTSEAIAAREETIARRRAAQRQAREQPPGIAPPAPEGRSPLARLAREEGLAWAQWRLATSQPFRERLVDFWMNHFTVSRRAGAVGALPPTLEREAIRPHLTGRFADMLVAATRHPAMLIYLDNHSSIGPNSRLGQRRNRGLNENLAREVLELHTLSPAGGYTQGDVQEFAKVLTGWSVNMDNPPYGFIWRPEMHEPGPKTLLGRRFPEGPESQEQVLRFLATHPATWRHLAVKLARHFVDDDPPPEAVRALEAALRRTEGDLGATYRVLIALPQAWDPPLSKLRSPQDFVLALLRATGERRPNAAVTGLAALGQPLWTAPQPNGWADTGRAWAAPEAIMRRVEWAYTQAGRMEQTDMAEVVEAALGPFARAETVAALRGAGSPREALTLLFGSPEFMRR